MLSRHADLSGIVQLKRCYLFGKIGSSLHIYLGSSLELHSLEPSRRQTTDIL